jgi:hypothetical protein
MALMQGHACARARAPRRDEPLRADVSPAPEPRRRTHVLEPPCDGRRSLGEQFAVLMFFADGKRRYVRRFASAREACRAFEHCIHSVEARFGIPMRVVITDRYDCILREWRFGKGITFP